MFKVETPKKHRRPIIKNGIITNPPTYHYSCYVSFLGCRAGFVLHPKVSHFHRLGQRSDNTFLPDPRSENRFNDAYRKFVDWSFCVKIGRACLEGGSNFRQLLWGCVSLLKPLYISQSGRIIIQNYVNRKPFSILRFEYKKFEKQLTAA